ncbi:MAG TPA: OmpA family protein [Caulobacteraceae bacterium]|jgi:outer membrane protein OmpA-like peptidoglycan-associated protein|nr:OmpA family protein [Caulobacteraceae bacterium]
MRLVTGLLVLGLACSSGSAFAQVTKPAHSPEDFAEAMKNVPCPDGQVRDDGGACQPEVGTRGFNLGAKSHPRPAPSVAKAKARPGRSLMDDLVITFHSGSAELTPEGQAEVKSFGEAMLMPWLAKRRFEIAGHTDASGSKKKNIALSRARADSVLDALVAVGVDRSRLEAKGYGSEQLAAPSAPRDPANRRVEARSLN